MILHHQTDITGVKPRIYSNIKKGGRVKSDFDPALYLSLFLPFSGIKSRFSFKMSHAAI